MLELPVRRVRLRRAGAARASTWSTFFLFFTVNTPDDMARLNIGGKRVTQELIDKWKSERGYDKPLYLNAAEAGQRASSPRRSSGTARCRCSRSSSAAPTARAPATSATRCVRRMWVSLQLALPLFILQVIASIVVRAAAGDVPPHAARLLGRGAVRADAVDLEPVLHHRRPVPVLARAASWRRSRATPAGWTLLKLPGAADAAVR